MNIVSKIVVVLMLLFSSASCRSPMPNQVKDLLIQVESNREVDPAYKKTSQLPIPQDSSTVYKKQSRGLISHPYEVNRDNLLFEKNNDSNPDTMSGETSQPFQLTKLINVEKESGYYPIKPEEVILQGETVKESQALKTSISTKEISSSYLAPPLTVADQIFNIPDNLARRFSNIPEEKPTDINGSRRTKSKSIGTALPTSLRDLTNELVIKINREKADIIENGKDEGWHLDEIMNEIGLASLIQNNSVEAISRVPGREILYKVTFTNPLYPEDLTGIDIEWYELNYFIEDLTMEENSFSDNTLDQLKAEGWYKGIINWGWSNGPDSDYRATGKDIIVAVIDSGVDYTLPELNIWTNKGEIPGNGIDDDNNGYVDDVYGWNFADKNNDPMDYDGHGTHVSGIINMVAHLSKIMPIKALNCNGGRILDIYGAIKYAVDNGAKVLNLSWGGDVESGLLDEAIDYAYSHNCIIVAASGNSSGEIPLYPARDHKIISVSAGNMFSNMTYFTNRGADILAPGKDIFSSSTGSGKEYKSGTSMAAPFVSGVAAGLLSIANPWQPKPELHPMEVLFNLKSQAQYNKNGFLSAYIKDPYRGIICRILSAKQTESGIEITALAKSPNAKDYVYSLDYSEGVNPGNPKAWKNIARIYKNTITEDERFIWDTSDLPSGIYTIRLTGRSFMNLDGRILPRSQGIIDKMAVKIDNQLDNSEGIATFLWSPFCKIDDTYNTYIEITNPGNNRVEITPIFYDLYGYEILSPLTAVIGSGNSSIDLKRYLPGSFKEYEGPVGIEIRNYSADIKISISTPHYRGDFTGKNEEEDIQGAAWAQQVPDKAQRDSYLTSFKRWRSKITTADELKNDLVNMPRLPGEAKLFLYNPTDEDASVNLTFFADGRLFDIGYRNKDYYGGWDEGGYNLYRADGLNGFDYNKINDSRQIIFEEDNPGLRKRVRYWQFTNYPFSFQSYSLVTKLGELRDDGTYSIERGSLVLTGSVDVPARSYILVPTWSFFDKGPIDYYWANSCMVTNIYPKGSVFGAVVKEKSGILEEAIPLGSFEQNPPSLD